MNVKDSIVHFETLGCKLNQIETESIARAFTDSSFSVDLTPVNGKSTENLDVFLCIINTCTVTAKAEQKARRVIRLLLSKYPKSVVIVTGCYAQVEKNQILALSDRIVVIPGSIKDSFIDLPCYLLGKINDGALSEDNLLKILNEFKPLKECTFPVKFKASTFKLSTDTFIHHSRASIKIQDGCNNSCTYCRIHIARGSSSSLDVNSVIERIKSIEEKNQNEVIITGVNLSQYKGAYRNENGDVSYLDFAMLIDFILKNTSRIAIRISSLYPDRVDDALCKVLNNERVRPHFHLSIQSGSERILRLMKRPYSRQCVVDAVSRIRAIKKDAFIACDIIAGFPSETEDDFNETLKLCRECNFSWIHAFPFSARPGTEAYSMEGKVPQNVSEQRVKHLTEFALSGKRLYIESFLGKKLHAIIEKNHEDKVIALTDNYLHVLVKTELQPKELWNKEVFVSVERCAEDKNLMHDIDCYGIIADTV